MAGSLPPGSVGGGSRPTPTLAGHLRLGGAWLARVSTRAWEAARSRGRALVHVWRRSLQVRVVSTTVVLCLVVISLLGTYLYSAIAGSLRDAKVSAAQQESLTLTRRAQDVWDSTTSTTVEGLNNASADIFERVLRPPGPQPTRFVVVTRSLANRSPTQLATFVSGDVGVAAISRDLREAVARNPTRQQTQVGRVLVDGEPVPAVTVGSAVVVPNAGNYDVYSIYPMTQEQQTMSLLTNASVIAGLILTILVGAVAWVVAREVVTPIRRAAATAERLASGKLNERMPSRGEDDLALLATSFNAMADSLQAQIRQLEGLSRVQHRFVSDVSHELRTPLTTIRMAVDVIHSSREGFEPTVARSAELLEGELDRFEALLADLLEISRFDAGAALLDCEPVDLRGPVERVIEASGAIARLRGSEMVVVGADSPVVAEIDERRVERILRNLVVNAIEHGEGRPVTVELASDGEDVAVVVADQGVGLRPGEASLVFTRFWRADPARARTTGGTGLGLAIALEDARLHNGWLQAWGEPGRGARFRLTLPRREGDSVTSSPLPLAPREGQ